MTPSTAREQLDLWKTVALASLVLSFGLAHCVTYADVFTDGAADANKVIMVKNVWVDVPLTQVLRDISMETGVAIVTCPHVPDPLVSLDTGPGKPFRDCMEELLLGRGLFVRKKSEKFYLVSCGSPTCPSSLEIAEYKRLCLKYISAKHLRSSLPKSVEQYVSTGGKGK